MNQSAPSSPSFATTAAAAATITTTSSPHHDAHSSGLSHPASSPPTTIAAPNDSDGASYLTFHPSNDSLQHHHHNDFMSTHDVSWPHAPSSPPEIPAPLAPSLPQPMMQSATPPPPGTDMDLDSDSDYVQPQYGAHYQLPPLNTLQTLHNNPPATQVGAVHALPVHSWSPTPAAPPVPENLSEQADTAPLWSPDPATENPDDPFAPVMSVHHVMNGSITIPPPPFVVPGADDPETEPYHAVGNAPQPMSLGPDNMGLGDFIHAWAVQNGPSVSRGYYPDALEWDRQVAKGPRRIECRDLKGDACDLQGINWAAIGVTRNSAQRRRTSTYHNYVNVSDSDKDLGPLHYSKPAVVEDFFRFRNMDIKRKVSLLHFQLRNLVGCGSKNRIFYPAGGVIQQLNPITGKHRSAMLFDNDSDAHVSTLAVTDDVLLVGGFYGDYHYRHLHSSHLEPNEGRLTTHISGITNHVQLHSARQSSTPLAAFASNDSGFRVVDLDRNELIQENMFPYALNCSALSADRRLRVMVGDCQEVLITDAERGEVVQRLSGHLDYGFACDWAPDGWTVATGNQDQTVRIWDARKWTRSDGSGCPITVIRSNMSGPRSLHFSPLGSGKRVLVAAEEADMIDIIDASTFDTAQTFDFFGEIGGVCFTDGGQGVAALSCDHDVGGILQLDRSDLGAENMYDFGHDGVSAGDREMPLRLGYDWLPSPEEILQLPGSQETLTQRKRRAAMRELTMAPL